MAGSRRCQGLVWLGVLSLGLLFAAGDIGWTGTGGWTAFLDSTGTLRPILPALPIILAPATDQNVELTTSGTGQVVINGLPMGSEDLTTIMGRGRTDETVVGEANFIKWGDTDFSSFIALGVDPSGGPTIQTQCSGGPCDQGFEVESPRTFFVQTPTLSCFALDPTTGTQTFTNACRPRGVLRWDANHIKPDGTHCTRSDDTTLNASQPDDYIKCTENAAMALYGGKMRLPDNYIGGSFFFTLEAADVDTAVSHVLSFLLSAQCRSPGEAINSTYSTGAAITVTMVTQFAPYASSEVTITPNGTCVAGDWLLWKMLANTGTNTDDGDALIIGVTAEYLKSSWGN